MMSFKRFFFLLPLLLLSFLYNGCSKKRSVLSNPKEKVFRFLLEQKPATIDPHFVQDTYGLQVASLSYESLYDYHFLKRPYEVQPLLAESLPEFSKDRKTVTIGLKKNIMFHDDACFSLNNGKGREVTADDVIYMFERIAAPKSVSPAYPVFERTVEGLEEFHQGKVKNISGVRAIGRHTIQIKLLRPKPRFIADLATVRTAIIPKECVRHYGEDFSRRAIGTGPFIFEKNESGNKFTFLKNPRYQTSTFENQRLPFLDKVVFEVNIEDQPTWLHFISGDTEVSRIPKDNFEAAFPGGVLASELKERGVQHKKEIRADVTAQFFNMKDPVWGKKKELRQAFALSLDVDKIIKLQYSGQAIRAHSMINPQQYGYDPSFRSRWAERDLKKAKELLARAGYPEGKGLPPLVRVSTSGATARLLNELIEKQSAEAGITIKTEVVTWPELQRKINEKNFVMTGIGYATDYQDADDALSLYHSRYIPSGMNAAGYQNPIVDSLIDEIEQMENGPPRLLKIKKLLDIVDEDLPCVPLVHRLGNQLAQPWVKNFIFLENAYFGMFLKYLKVESSQ